MKFKLKELEILTKEALVKIGFQEQEAAVVAAHLVDAEISGKRSHGVSRIKHFKDKMGGEMFDPGSPEPVIEKKTPVSWRVNGYLRSGIYPIEKFLSDAFVEAHKVGMFSVASTFGVNSGTIGIYARKAAENGLIYIGFHNSSGGLIPFGAAKDIWGTNPFTVGLPSNELPVILDFASTKITYGDVLEAISKNKELPKDSVLDAQGRPSTKPQDAWEGGILAMAGHKGSGLGMIVELLAGGLSLSRVGSNTSGGWGSFYILINPEIFRPLGEFKQVVSTAIAELKALPKADGFDEIFFPGERSQKLRLAHLEKGEVDIEKSAYNLLK